MGEVSTVQAAIETKKLIEVSSNISWLTIEGLDKYHNLEILDKIINGKVTGGKADRMLGWVQASATAANVLSLDGWRNLNRKCLMGDNV